MKQPRLLWFKLRDLLSRHRNVRKLDDEIQFHIDQQMAENIAAGMSPEQARYTAMRLFGNPTWLKEETRATWGWMWLEQIGQETSAGKPQLKAIPFNL